MLPPVWNPSGRRSTLTSEILLQVKAQKYKHKDIYLIMQNGQNFRIIYIISLDYNYWLMYHFDVAASKGGVNLTALYTAG